MKRIESTNLVEIKGGASAWTYYLVSCGIATSLLEASFLAGPAVGILNASYVSSCALLGGLYGVSSHK